jgi:hypothetical protein
VRRSVIPGRESVNQALELGAKTKFAAIAGDILGRPSVLSLPSVITPTATWRDPRAQAAPPPSSSQALLLVPCQVAAFLPRKRRRERMTRRSSPR